MAKTDLTVRLTGADGNVFNLCGLVSHALKGGGHHDLAEEMSARLWKCESYDAALQLFMEYVTVV